MEEASESLSALQENIKNKGNNAYYYAHGMKVNGPQWDGKEEPRLLETKTVVSAQRRKISLTSYAWTDEKKSVRIYVDFENAETIDDGAVSLDTTDDMLRFVVAGASEDHILVIDSLHDKIASATVKKKTGRFLLTLKKEVPCTWYNLKKASSKL